MGDAVEDMISLPILSEDTILANLEKRYHQDLIYTFTGSILVSINPYALLPIYELKTVKNYIGKRLGSMPPHIFAIADDAYSKMAENGKNQSLIISGESGAGKTEATKLILQYLSARTNKHSPIERRILESSPILESFGNAKTVRNNNSSRFGKYMEVQFGGKDEISGARIIQYLLEKSRIVFQAESERNYHIFYQVFHHEEKDRLFLTQPEDFHYLNQSGCIRMESIDDQDDFERMKNAMGILAFKVEEQDAIFATLASVLHIGNAQFKLKAGAKSEASDLEKQDPVNHAAALLQTDAKALGTALCQRINVIRGEKIVVPLTVNEAKATRDALAKFVYGNLFNWLVNRINMCIAGTEQPKAHIGVLDIFGFENFAVNSFEQLCINFTNEKLQQLFNQFIFKLEQEEYEKEGINWSKLQFVDNIKCIELIESRPMGIISLLDEECRFPKGTDLTWLEKMNQAQEKHPHYEKPRTSKDTFIVKHYAGDVSYWVDGFLEKNKDKLQDELVDICYASKNPNVQLFFLEAKREKDASSDDGGSGAPAGVKAPAGKGPALNVSKGSLKKSTSLTVAAKFKDSLVSLVQALSLTEPHYVRCIKPNTLKAAKTWDREMVMAQLRYAGMMETVKIRKQGFPNRMTFKEFWDRYRVIAPDLKMSKDPRADVAGLLKKFTFLNSEFIQVGKTKVFYKDDQKYLMDDKRNQALQTIVIPIQKLWRGYRVRKQYVKTKKSAVTFQKLYRMWKARSLYLQIREKVIHAQAVIRGHQARKRVNHERSRVVKIQAGVRRWHAKRLYQKLLKEKKEREAAEKKEAERRALLAKEERDRLEKEDKLRKDKERAEAAKIAEEERLKDLEERERDEQRKRADEEKREAERAKKELEELGLTNEMKDLELNIQKDKLPDIDNIEDDDLLDKMMDPEFFGEIPDTILTPLEQIASDVKPVDEKAAMDFEFLEAPPPPPLPPGGFGGAPPLPGRGAPPPLPGGGPPPLPGGPPPIPGRDGPPPIPGRDAGPPPIPGRDAGPPPIPGGRPPAVGAPPGKGTTIAPSGANPKATIKEKKQEVMRVITSTEEPPVVLLPIEADAYSFKMFCAKYFADAKKAGAGKKGLDSFSKKPIEGSLLRDLPSDLEKEAEVVFGKIMQYMGDKKGTVEGPILARYICSKGISHEELRDEIYCQLCKQCNGSPNANKGWELISFCCSAFAPTEKFLKYLGSFFLQAPDQFRELAAFSMRSLRRTLQNGTRKAPPSSTELQHLLKRQPILARIKFMDGTEKAFLIESATTAGEAFSQVVLRLNLVDAAGFGLFEVYNNIARKLAPGDCLADSMSKAESLQNSMPKGKKINFNFLFKKSTYLHGKKTFADPVERDLMYYQLSAEVLDGVLPISIEMVPKLLALKLHVELGDYDINKASDELLGRSVPKNFADKKDPAEWAKIMKNEYMMLRGLGIDDAKLRFLTQAQDLPLFGSTVFANLSSPSVTLVPASYDLAINMKGLNFIPKDGKSNTKTFSYSELAGTPKNQDQTFSTVVVSLRNGNKINIVSEGEGGRICGVVKEYMDTIQTSAQFCRALYDYQMDDPTVLSFKRGEIITLREKNQETGWFVGELNGRTGVFPGANVELVTDNNPANLPPLPPLPAEPAAPALPSRGSESPETAPRKDSASEGLGQGPPGEEDLKGTIRLRKEVKGTIKRKTINMERRLMHEKSPLKASLLELPETYHKDAKEAFLLIMKYMGDYPYKGQKDKEILQQLVQLGIDSLILRDEILCQLAKQTSNNPSPQSNARGWHLIVFCASSFLASNEFFGFWNKHLNEGVDGGDPEVKKLAQLALQRMGEVTIKGPRKRAPAEAEIDATLQDRPIVTRIYLLDSTTKAIHVRGTTVVKEAVADLNSKFSLTAAHGFGLFEVNHEADNSILPLAQSDYLCDYLATWEKAAGARPLEECFKFLYKKKLFLLDVKDDIQLASNPTTAIIFNLVFHQLLYDVRNSKLPVSIEDSYYLAALQLQIKFGNFDKKNKPINKNNVQSVVPKHIRASNFNPDEWIANMEKEHEKLTNTDLVKCKILFIQRIQSHPLYGACLFNVTTKGPKVVVGKTWLAITKKGVSIWDPYGREPKYSWTFDQIGDGGPSKDGSFWLRTGNVLKPEKYIFTGPEANFIMDIYNAHKEAYESTQNATFVG